MSLEFTTLAMRGGYLLACFGFGYPEVQEAFGKIQELSKIHTNWKDFFPAMFGLWAYLCHSGHGEESDLLCIANELCSAYLQLLDLLTLRTMMNKKCKHIEPNYSVIGHTIEQEITSNTTKSLINSMTQTSISK